MRVPAAGLLLALLTAAALASAADDWPTVRGDFARTSARGDVPGPGTGEVVWTFTTEGYDVGAPAVADGRVFAGSSDGKVHALDARTGALLWTTPLGGTYFARSVAAEGRVFYPTNKTLFALDAEDGRILWSVPTLSRLPGVTVADGVVYLSDKRLTAIDAATGAIRWTYAPDAWWRRDVVVTGPPVVFDGRVYFAFHRHQILALDAETGRPRWEASVRSVDGPLATDGRSLFASTGDGVAAFAQKNGTTLWTAPGTGHGYGVVVRDDLVLTTTNGSRVVALNTTSGEQAWERDLGWELLTASPDTLYGVEVDSEVAAVDLADGHVAWQTAVRSFLYDPPTLVDGVLYFGGEGFKIVAVDAGAGLPQQPSAVRAPEGAGIPAPALFAALALAAAAGVRRRG